MARRILITSALPYVNNVPHLGNIIGCVLSADVFARFCRLKAYDTLYVCGTDEHGTATETKAIEEGLTPRQIVDKYFEIHRRIYAWFNISFDAFGRTSSETHKAITQEIFKKVDANGFVTRHTVEQLFDPKANKFLADRFVEGTCPHCGYESARGDQCDKCQKLLTPTELKDPRSKISGATPVLRESEHLFLDLEKLQPVLEDWVDKTHGPGFWTENAIRTTEGWFKEGLKARAITRDLSWGVPVPKPGFENKVFYVWFDAPIGYISITAAARKDWKEWWQSDDVELFQFMAKDNIPFHTILFPATLLATKAKYTMLHHIDSTEYLNYETGKFSKSRNVGVFGDDAVDSGIPADIWRFYLLLNRPETSDSVFTWQEFADRVNNELVANLANLVNRTTTFISKFQESRIGTITDPLVYDDHIKKVEDLLEKVQLRRAMQEIFVLSRIGNQYFQEQQPWQTIKTDPKKAQNALANLANLVKDLAILVSPFMPNIAQSIREQLKLPDLTWNLLSEKIQDHTIGTPQILVKKFEDVQVKELHARFSGRKPADPSMLDLRVARIEDVQDHPKADKLYILQIDLGSQKRQLVAGLRSHYTKEELQGKHIVVVANLQPASLRGVESQGMLLAADDGKQVGLLTTDAAPGTPVAPEGVRSKGTIITYDEFSAIELKADGGKALVQGKPLTAEGKDIGIERVSSGKIK
ncbi:MAG: methionine--tRNA ligase [Nanoarchaeota archaeon]